MACLGLYILIRAGLTGYFPYFKGIAAFAIAALWLSIFISASFVQRAPLIALVTLVGLLTGCVLAVYLLKRPYYRNEALHLSLDGVAKDLLFLGPPLVIAFAHAQRLMRLLSARRSNGRRRTPRPSSRDAL